MKPSPAFALILMLSLLGTSGCTDAPQELPQEHATPEPIQPALIGEGVISTELPEFATTLSPDGQTMYFNVTSADRDTLQIMASSMNDEGTWSSPFPVSFSDGTYFDVDPFVSHDGSRIYFNSDRPLQGATPEEELDTWYAEWQGDTWSEPINLGSPANGPQSEVFVSLTKDQTLYFSISTDGIRSFFRSAYTPDGYLPPEPVDLGLPDSVSVGNPLIDPDEQFLLFTSRFMDSLGGADLFIADRREDDSFGNIRNLGALVNTPYSEFAPGLSPDKSTLYFASERPGIVGPLPEGRPPSDLYQISFQAVLDDIAAHSE